MNEFEQNQRNDYDNAKCADPRGATVGVNQKLRSTPAEDAKKSANYHYEQADKHARAAAFFASNPQFSEFIELIRAGVIGI